MNDDRQMEVLAVAVHGALAALHGLSVVYNIRRRNKFDTTVHALAFIYDAWAVRQHLKELR